MSELSTFHWIVTLAVVFSLIALAARASAGRVSLVLRHFDVRCQPNRPDQPVVLIVGRRAGIIAFILTVLQLEAQTTFSVSVSGVDYESASVFGRTRKFVPLSRVASTTAGVHRPIGYVFTAFCLLLLGLAAAMATGSSMPFLILTLIAAALTVLYFIGKSVLIEISSNAGREISLQFRPGVIESVPVDFDKVLAAAAVVRDLIVGKAPEVFRQPNTTPVPAHNDAHGNSFEPFGSSMPFPPPPLPANGTPLPGTERFATAADDEQQAHETLRHAVQLFHAGRRDEAAAAMNRVIELYPYTASAKTAAANLKKIGGK